MSQVYVQPFPGPGPRTTISTEEGGSPRWATDGRQLFFWSGRRIMAAAVRTYPLLRAAEPRLIVDARRPWGYAGVTPDGLRFLTFSPRSTGGAPELRVILNWYEDLERLAPHPRP